MPVGASVRVAVALSKCNWSWRGSTSYSRRFGRPSRRRRLGGEERSCWRCLRWTSLSGNGACRRSHHRWRAYTPTRTFKTLTRDLSWLVAVGLIEREPEGYPARKEQMKGVPGLEGLTDSADLRQNPQRATSSTATTTCRRSSPATSRRQSSAGRTRWRRKGRRRTRRARTAGRH